MPHVSALTCAVKPSNRASWLNSVMPSLPERLQEVMRATGWKHADLMRVTGQSSSVVSQWLGNGSKEIATIGSLEAAIAIENESGFSALWVAKGIGERKPSRLARPLQVQETPAIYLTPERTLASMAQLLGNVAPELRRTFGDMLKGWAEDGGDPARIPALLAVLGVPRQNRTPGPGVEPLLFASLKGPHHPGIIRATGRPLVRVEAIDRSWGLF